MVILLSWTLGRLILRSLGLLFLIFSSSPWSSALPGHLWIGSGVFKNSLPLYKELLGLCTALWGFTAGGPQHVVHRGTGGGIVLNLTGVGHPVDSCRLHFKTTAPCELALLSDTRTRQ